MVSAGEAEECRTDKAGRDRAAEVIDVGRRRRGIVVQRVANAEHETLDERIVVAKTWQYFMPRGVPRQNAFRDFLDERAPEIEMKGLQRPAEPDAKIHAARHHEHAARRDKAAALAIWDATMDHNRTVEVQYRSGDLEQL